MIDGIHREAGGGYELVERTLLAYLLSLSVASIRRHCEPAACDVKTHRALYLCDIADLRGTSPTLRYVARRRRRTSSDGRVVPAVA